MNFYGLLRVNYNFTRNPITLYRYLKRINFYKDLDKKRNNYKPQKYHTPFNIGEKMQMDVKYVPTDCKKANIPDHKKFYQYTMIDEATRERFIYMYEELTAKSTVDFLNRAIVHYGYIPKIVQTDNGNEFAYNVKTTKKHLLVQECEKLGIFHKRIRAYTPRHNGKVERSHRNDNERFYKFLKFGSLQELLVKAKEYLIRSNNIPTVVLGWLSPNQKRDSLLSQ